MARDGDASWRETAGGRPRQVLYYETVSLRLQTLELMVDTVLVRTLFLFVLSTYLDLAKMATAVVEATTRGQPRRADAVVPPKVYLRWLNLQPLRLHLSCRSVAGGRRREAVRRDEAADLTPSKHPRA